MLADKETLEWVNKMHPTTEKTVSICSGSRILGILGLLDGLEYCTHHQVYDDMEKIVPTGIPQKLNVLPIQEKSIRPVVFRQVSMLLSYCRKALW